MALFITTDVETSNIIEDQENVTSMYMDYVTLEKTQTGCRYAGNKI
jgi:hypothetical protein